MPSVVDLKNSPNRIIILSEALLKHINSMEKLLNTFLPLNTRGVQENALIYCMSHSIDIGKGCHIAVTNALPDSSTTLTRAMIETLIWSRYVTQSLNNAVEFRDSYLNELRRTTRKNLSAGYARIVEKATGKTITDSFLESDIMQDIPKRVSIEAAAKSTGLGQVYSTLYGFLSMIAHGRAAGMRKDAAIEVELYASLSAALGSLECIEQIAQDWFVNHKSTPCEVLSGYLGIKLSSDSKK
jgi:hypothetical protein